MKTRFCALMMLAACPMAAQPPAEKTITKLVEMKYFGDRAAGLLDGIGLIVKNSGRMIVITGPEDRVNAAEVILKQIDVPPPPQPPGLPEKNIQLTAWMVVASPREQAGKPLPEELEPVVKQLHGAFPYKSYTLLESAFLSVANHHKGLTKGLLPPVSKDLPGGGSYTLSVGYANLIGPGAVELDNFELLLIVPKEIRIATAVEIGDGQKVVVGRANVDGVDSALIVVLTAKVVD